MPPAHQDLDPLGYYARLGLKADATREAIQAAYRAKARLLHPDVPGTGNATAFMSVKQAYDVLSKALERDAYDREARRAAAEKAEAKVHYTRPTRTVYTMAPQREEPPPTRWPRLSDLPRTLWLGIGLFLAFGVYEVVTHLRTSETGRPRVQIPATAEVVPPQSAAAQHETLYGPQPVNLPGKANFYVKPGSPPAMIFQLQPDQKTLVPSAALPPFSAVEGVRLFRQSGMMEIVTGDRTTGFVPAQHLTPGNRIAARDAYCAYNAGQAPADGDILQRGTRGLGTLTVENHALQPAVLRLRTPSGAVAVAVFLAPGSNAELAWLPSGDLTPEFAIGELWSRACNRFSAGMRAWRFRAPIHVPGTVPLVLSDGTGNVAGLPLSEEAFEKP